MASVANEVADEDASSPQPLPPPPQPPFVTLSLLAKCTAVVIAAFVATRVWVVDETRDNVALGVMMVVLLMLYALRKRARTTVVWPLALAAVAGVWCAVVVGRLLPP